MFVAGFEFFFGIIAALFVLFILVPTAIKIIYNYFWWIFLITFLAIGLVCADMGIYDPLVILGLCGVMRLLYIGFVKEKRAA